MQREGLVRRKRRQGGGAGAVSDEAAGHDVLSGGGDLTVGDAEDDGVRAGAVGPAAEWPGDGETGVAQGGDEGAAKAAPTHDGYWGCVEHRWTVRPACSDGRGIKDTRPKMREAPSRSLCTLL